MASSLARDYASCEAIGEPRDLLNALFKSSAVGVAICDRQLRYRAVNDALASMNGIPAERHLGKTIHAVLGQAAAKVQPAFEHVFATGQPLSNVELTAELPARRGIANWSASYFPLKDQAGQVLRVGAVVLELTKHNDLDAAIRRLTDKLTRIASALRNDPGAPDTAGLGGTCTIRGTDLARAVGLLDNCMSEMRAIAQLLHVAPPLTVVQPLRLARNSLAKPPEGGHDRNFAAVHAIESETEYLSPLSTREREVVALLATGKTNREIAAKLLISTRTVESHRARIMLKLDLHSLSDLVLHAVRSRLIQP